MNATVNIQNANIQILDTIASFLKNFEDVKFEIDKDYSKIKNDIEECEKEFQEDLKNGTLKTFKSAREMFEDRKRLSMN